MNPQNDQRNAQVGMPRNDQPTGYHVVAPPRQQASPQQAAADVIRGQLDSIYSGGSGESTPHTTPVVTPQPIQQPAEETELEIAPQPAAVSPEPAVETFGHGLRTAPDTPSNPDDSHLDTSVDPQPTQAEEAASTYSRTMDTRVGTRQPSKDQWQQYHSAWQQYYKMYYERQYLTNTYLASQSGNEIANGDQSSETLSQQEAMKELRESIRQKVAASAVKVKKSRHFMPIVAGLVVLLAFIFLQYNRVFFGAVAAYTTPGNIEPQNIIVDPTVDVVVGPEPRMIIPKINVDAPVVYGIGPDENSQMAAMEKGIAHFSIPGANAVPGQVGNAVFAAHSSNDVFARGDYKFVFAQNEKLTKGDVIYMNFEGKRYTYSVTKLEVVLPSEVSKIQIDTDKPMLTLISCVPLGTAEKRLLIFAEQVSPDPGGAVVAEEANAAPEAANIPGEPAPTLLEKIFGIR